MKTRNETYTNSVLVATTFPLSAGLGADRATLPADGTTVATCNWAGTLTAPGASVTVSVNGATSSLATTRDATTHLDTVDFEVTASVAGPVEIIANGVDTLTLQAT